MRLSQEHIRVLKRLAEEEAGPSARLRLFGSRLDDAARGGDVDLLLELDTPVAHPAPLIARLAARASRAMDGRKVDVLLLAPNLMRQPIHDIAQRQGVLL
ncbi:hypothetical protein [Denitratimonas sp. CY0512]|uniref:hypothetical protein n=1 Tax=Denitratimonas sp. CY0512 TaxID=3131940 RepID=UPI003098C97A